MAGSAFCQMDNEEVITAFRRRNESSLPHLFYLHGGLPWIVLIINPGCHWVVSEVECSRLLQDATPPARGAQQGPSRTDPCVNMSHKALIEGLSEVLQLVRVEHGKYLSCAYLLIHIVLLELNLNESHDHVSCRVISVSNVLLLLKHIERRLLHSYHQWIRT